MKILSIAFKDMQLLAKDRGSVFMLFLLPLLFIVVFSGILNAIGSSGPADTRIALPVVDQDKDSAAKTLLSRIDAAGGVRTEMIEESAALSGLDKKDLLHALFIPAGFTRDLAAGKPVTLRLVTHPDALPKQTEAIRLVVDGAAGDMSLESQVLAGLRQMGEMQPGAAASFFSTDRILAQARSQFTRSQTRPLISIVEKVPNQEGTREADPSLQMLAIPGLTILFVFVTAQTTARSIFDEKKAGAFRRLMAAPLSKPVLLAGKLLPNFIISLLQILVIFAFGTLGMRLLGMPSISIENAPLAVLVVSILIALCSSALGIFIASLAHTENQVGGLSTLLLYGTGLLGGCVAPIFILERFLGPIPQLVPQYWANRALDNLLVRGLGFGDVLLEMAILLGFTILFFVIGILRFDFE